MWYPCILYVVAFWWIELKLDLPLHSSWVSLDESVKVKACNVNEKNVCESSPHIHAWLCVHWILCVCASVCVHVYVCSVSVSKSFSTCSPDISAKQTGWHENWTICVSPRWPDGQTASNSLQLPGNGKDDPETFQKNGNRDTHKKWRMEEKPRERRETRQMQDGAFFKLPVFTSFQWLCWPKKKSSRGLFKTDKTGQDSRFNPCSYDASMSGLSKTQQAPNSWEAKVTWATGCKIEDTRVTITAAVFHTIMPSNSQNMTFDQPKLLWLKKKKSLTEKSLNEMLAPGTVTYLVYSNVFFHSISWQPLVSIQFSTVWKSIGRLQTFVGGFKCYSNQIFTDASQSGRSVRSNRIPNCLITRKMSHDVKSRMTEVMSRHNAASSRVLWRTTWRETTVCNLYWDLTTWWWTSISHVSA